MFHLLVHFADWLGMCQGKAGNPEFLLCFLCGFSNPTVSIFSAFLGHQQTTTSEVEQPDLELTPVWDAKVTGSSFIDDTTILVPTDILVLMPSQHAEHNREYNQKSLVLRQGDWFRT